jgi:hypothetical protein
VLEGTLLYPELYHANALVLRGLKRSVSRDVLWGEFWDNEDGRFGVRQVKLEFRNRVCRVERRGDCSGRQEAMSAF